MLGRSSGLSFKAPTGSERKVDGRNSGKSALSGPSLEFAKKEVLDQFKWIKLQNPTLYLPTRLGRSRGPSFKVSKRSERKVDGRNSGKSTLSGSSLEFAKNKRC